MFCYYHSFLSLLAHAPPSPSIDEFPKGLMNPKKKENCIIPIITVTKRINKLTQLHRLDLENESLEM